MIIVYISSGKKSKDVKASITDVIKRLAPSVTSVEFESQDVVVPTLVLPKGLPDTETEKLRKFTAFQVVQS